jgi:hypothetical protein
MVQVFDWRIGLEVPAKLLTMDQNAVATAEHEGLDMDGGGVSKAIEATIDERSRWVYLLEPAWRRNMLNEGESTAVWHFLRGER